MLLQAFMAAVSKRAAESAVMGALSAQQLLALLSAFNVLPVEPQFQLAVAAARHISNQLCSAQPAPPATLLVECLYQCLLQGVQDQQAATSVLDAVAASATAGRMDGGNAAAKALLCAQRMSCAQHAAVPALQGLLQRAPASEALMQQVAAVPSLPIG